MNKNTSSPIQSLKTMKMAYSLKKFNVKYPKTLNLEFQIIQPHQHPQKIDIDLKKTLTKRFICQKLVISFCDYHNHNKSQNNLGVLLRQLPKYSNIKYLAFRFSGKVSSHNYSPKLVENFLPKLRKLKGLHIQNYSYMERININSYVKNLRKLTQLRHLTLNFHFRPSKKEELFQVLFQRLSKLKNLLQSLSLYNYSYENMHEDLSFNLMGSTISQFRHLQSLNLDLRCFSQLSDAAILRLTQQLSQLSKHLKAFDLNLSMCKKISNLGMQTIIEFATHELKNLTSLGLSFREPKKFQDENFLEIGVCLSHLINLNHLNICFENVRNLTNDGFVQLLILVSKLEYLKSLKIEFQYFRKIKDRGLAEIGNFVAKMPNLTSLELILAGSKQITNKGFSKFEENIGTSKSLKSLALQFHWTNISDSKIQNLVNIFAQKNLNQLLLISK